MKPCLALLTICLAGLASVCSGSVEAETKNVRVNLRRAPSLKAPILSKLPPKARLTIVSECKYWYKVKYSKCIEGYIYRDLVVKGKNPPVPDTSGKGMEVIRQQATIAFAGRNWSEVIRLLDETPGSSALSAGDGYMLGMAYRELGMFDRAEGALVRALGKPERKWDATSAEIYRQLVGIQQKRNRWPEVLDTVKRVTAQLPSASWIVQARAEAYLQLRKPGEALAEYQAMLMKNPDDAEAFVGMGRARMGLNDLRGAEDDFQTALRKFPKNEDAFLGLADLYLKRHQLQMAEAILKKASEVLPDSVPLKDRLTSMQRTRQLGEQRTALMKKQDELHARLSADSISLHNFIVVAQLKPKLYEIRLENEDAAFLQTSRSSFSGPGRHEVALVDGGEIPVRLSPKKGGFMRKAKLFRELSDSQEIRYQQTVMELRDISQALALIHDEQRRQATVRNE